MTEQIQPSLAVKREESGIDWIEKQRGSATKKWIGERIKPVITGWQEADAPGLDQIALALKEHFNRITFFDILEHFDAFHRFHPYFYLLPAQQSRDESRSKLESLVADGDFEDMGIIDYCREISTKKRTSKKEPLYEKMSNFNLGEPFHQWLQEALSSPDPKKQAKAVYLAFAAENPFLSIPKEVAGLSQALYERQKRELPEEERVVIDDEQERQEILDRVSYFLIETGFAASSNKPVTKLITPY